MDGIKSLAFAIINQAVEDWYDARFVLDTLDRRYFSGDELDVKYKREKRKIEAESKLSEVERFFKSDWYMMLCPEIAGDKALNAMMETYKNEVFDQKMKHAPKEWRLF